MDKEKIQKIKLKLEKERESIEKQLETFAEKDLSVKNGWRTKFPEYNDDQLETAADEVEEYSAMLPIEFALERKLKNVNLALEKIERGEYGICEKCGTKISEERLKASPEINLCLKCEKKNWK